MSGAPRRARAMLVAMVDDRITALKAVPLFNHVSDKDLLRILDI